MEYTCYIIANGGYITEPVVEKLTLSTEDEEYDTDEFADFEDYVISVVAETRSEFEQKFASAIVLTESQFNTIQTYGK